MIATIAPRNTRPPTTPAIVAAMAVLSGGPPLLFDELVVADAVGPPGAWRMFLRYFQPNSEGDNRSTYEVCVAWLLALVEDVVGSAFGDDEVSPGGVVVVEVGLFWGGPFPWPTWARRIRMLICLISNWNGPSLELCVLLEWTVL